MNTIYGKYLICPVCRQALYRSENTYKCSGGHCYDIAKKGYVNLAMSQRSSKKRHGDDKLMTAARRSFLDKGYYNPLADLLVEETAALFNKYTAQSSEDVPVIVDIGCGEGYYTSALHNALPDADIYGIDISKDALICAAGRDKKLTLAAASAAAVPMADGCADAAVSLFAPTFPGEFRRLLKPDGVLIRAVPLENHLFGLKSAIYEKPYRNPPDSGEIEGFKIAKKRVLSYSITLDNSEDIANLFMMTPYYYKTSREDQQRLRSLDSLKTEIEFGVFIYNLQ